MTQNSRYVINFSSLCITGSMCDLYECILHGSSITDWFSVAACLWHITVSIIYPEQNRCNPKLVSHFNLILVANLETLPPNSWPR